MIPKSIQNIIILNLKQFPAPYAYRLEVNKHIPGRSIEAKLESLTKWVNRLCPNSIEIVKEERIVGDNRVVDLHIYDPASRIIDDYIETKKTP